MSKKIQLTRGRWLTLGESRRIAMLSKVDREKAIEALLKKYFGK